jgi:hypothetical protein
MKWLEENFDDFFDIYWMDSKIPKTRQELMDFNATYFSEDAMTVNFTMKFFKPYEIGLFTKKSDKLYIDRKMNETS